MSEILALLESRKRAIEQDIARLRIKLELIEELIAEHKTAPAKKITGSELGPGLRGALVALEQAGNKGLSAKELAAMSDRPESTTSSRLSMLKKQGLATLDRNSHKYFVVHSEQQDNNTTGVGAP